MSKFLTLALVCWARYIEDRDMKAITSKSFVLITSSFALTVEEKKLADIGSAHTSYLSILAHHSNMSYASALQVSCLAKEWDTEHFARHFHS